MNMPPGDLAFIAMAVVIIAVLFATPDPPKEP